MTIFKTKRSFLWISCLCLFLCSCKNDDRSILADQNYIELACNDYANIETSNGVFNNNVWNKNAAGKRAWRQCLIQATDKDQLVYGWAWDWPAGGDVSSLNWLIGSNVIYAYPQVKQGASPWAPEPSFDERFPLKISELEEFKISHQLKVKSSGRHNTATSLWLVNEPYRGVEAKPSIIDTEVMIWTDYSGKRFSPAGTKVDVLSIEGVEWEVWYQKNWEDKSGVNENTWSILSFYRTKAKSKVSINVLKMLSHAQTRGLIAQDLWVADVELGNEIMDGQGIALVRDFTVDIK